MLPCLLPQDLIYLKKISLRQIKVGDICLVRFARKFSIHRVIYRNRRYFISKGDNNPLSDGKLTAKNLIAKAYQVQRNGQTFDIDTLYLLQSSLYLTEILKVKQLFEQNRISYLFLKGLPLHLLFEGKLPRRVYADCDILIDKQEFSLVKKLFIKAGYHRANFDLSDAHKRLRDKDPEISFIKTIKDFPVIFDIHLEAVFMMTQLGQLEALYPQKLLDSYSQHLLDNKRMVKIQGEVYPILGKEDLFIYLLLHLFHHNFRGAYRYDLILKVLRKGRLNWDVVEAILIRYRLENFAYASLLLLCKYYQPKLPIQARLALARWKEGHRFVAERVLKEDIFSEEPRTSSGVKRFLYLFLLSPGAFLKKMFIFTSPAVLYSVFWTLGKLNWRAIGKNVP